VIIVGINGFGRIGRNFLRCWLGPRDSQLQLVGINDTSDPKTNAHLLKHDSILGKLDADIQVDENSLIVND
jgi:glyceraldehyde-3-phosphate dehydrogenase (NAD(P))